MAVRLYLGIYLLSRDSYQGQKGPEEPPRKIMDAVVSGMAKSEAVWVNLIARRCNNNVCRNAYYYQSVTRVERERGNSGKD